MTIRVAVIGLGSIAQKAYLPLLAAWEGIELLFCSRSAQTVATSQAQHRVARGTTRLEELLDWGPQAAFVLTPSHSHREIVERLLLAGVDVFVEKPATLASHETQQLAELAEARKRVLMVCFNRRYAPLHRQARDLWGDRPVGMAVLEKHRASAFHPTLYQNYIDDTIHQIDLLRFFCGEAQAVHTFQQVESGKLVGAASTASLNGGGAGLVLTSLKAGGWIERYALHGEGASLYINAFTRLVFVSGGTQRVWEETYVSSWQTTLKGRGFEDQIAHFFDCLQTRQTPQTSAWEAMKTQQLLEGMVARAAV